MFPLSRPAVHADDAAVARASIAHVLRAGIGARSSEGLQQRMLDELTRAVSPVMTTTKQGEKSILLLNEHQLQVRTKQWLYQMMM